MALIALGALFLILQYALWISPDGVRETVRLHRATASQAEENAQLRVRNEQLAAEVQDLKSGLDAIEERARRELGMIAAGEVFYQVVDDRQADR